MPYVPNISDLSPGISYDLKQTLMRELQAIAQAIAALETKKPEGIDALTLNVNGPEGTPKIPMDKAVIFYSKGLPSNWRGFQGDGVYISYEEKYASKISLNFT